MLAMTKYGLVLIALLLAACGEDRPPAPTEADNRQLDEAEAMLNEAAGNEAQSGMPEACKTHPPYDDAKYDEWRQRALEAGCDKYGNKLISR